MVDESKERCRSVVPPSASLPPPPPPVTIFNQAKNLMKSPASLIGKEKAVSKKSALDLCKDFIKLRCRNESSEEPEFTKWSWIYHNNDVDACLQDGPTCGLVALKMASDMLRKSGYLDINKCTENEIPELVQLSKDSGFTYEGEMFSARDLASLAQKYYGIRYKVIETGIKDCGQLVESVIQGYPVILPYDCDKNNEPCTRKGHNSHWAIITGFLLGTTDMWQLHTSEKHLIHAEKLSLPANIDSENLFIIARHGKSRHYGLWPWWDLYNSNNNLIEFDSQGIEISGRKCFLTEGIKKGLCSKTLFFYP